MTMRLMVFGTGLGAAQNAASGRASPGEDPRRRRRARLWQVLKKVIHAERPHTAAMGALQAPGWFHPHGMELGESMLRRVSH